MRGVSALVAEGGKSGDKEMEKLFVSGEVFDGGVKVVAELFAKDMRSLAEDFRAFGEERDFWLVGRDGVIMIVRMEEVVEVGVGKS